jgi:hypothetical protein
MEKKVYEEMPERHETIRIFGGLLTVIRLNVKETENGWECDELLLSHKEPHADMAAVKKAIDDYINARTDERILSGFVWNGKSVWLSDENQRNFSEAQRVAMITGGQSLPMTFKLGEDAEGNPVYHEFTSVEELTGFYLAAVAYINQCLNEGWLEKDSIDMKDYGYE